jgi:hypothetical protein
VAYFDLQVNRLRRWNVEDLFAKPDLNKPAVEQALCRIESVVAARLDDIVSTDNDATLGDALADPDVCRALSLLFLLQMLRSREALSGLDADFNLEGLLLGGDAQRDLVLRGFRARCELGVVRIAPVYRLFLQDTGIFVFPVPQETVGYAWGFGMPLSPTALVAAIPVGVKGEVLQNAPWLHGFSVGPSKNIARIVVPPEYVHAMEREELCAEILRRRALSDRLFDDIAQFRKLVARRNSMFGL